MKAAGIIAVIIGVFALLVPVYGPYITIISGLLAAVSAKDGTTFGAVAIGLNIINIAFLSPTIWLAEVMSRALGFWGIGTMLVGVQIVAAIGLVFLNRFHEKENL